MEFSRFSGWVGGFGIVHFPDSKKEKYALKMHQNA